MTSEITRERFLEFDEIYRQNCADYGIPSKPRECIEFLCSESVRGRFTQLYLAVMEGNVVAGLLVLFSPTTVNYYVPCLRASFRSQQPGSLLIDHAVQEAHSRGLRYWNWESSPAKTLAFTLSKSDGARRKLAIGCTSVHSSRKKQSEGWGVIA